ncbi:hypothetical protein TeGR_g657 [Tetraparma gracilis]|uniref:Uncharacterized protein n=1 Tax=Tetraparma gracilis TaxID=2962635 RepID=A0ABQ6MR17_9STRA|nr:hypothetical protein TeGR_g657 [Tetraparma gracilis]
MLPSLLLRRSISTVPGRVSSLSGPVLLTAGGAELHLPPAEGPVGPLADGTPTYKKGHLCPVSSILRTSTHVGVDPAGKSAKGRVGSGGGEIPWEDARLLARSAGLRLLATLHDQLGGDVGRIEQVLSLRGMVREGEGFTQHGGVINGCSEVFIEALGPDKGVGVRVCSGAGASGGAAVSCEVEVRVRPA